MRLHAVDEVLRDLGEGASGDESGVADVRDMNRLRRVRTGRYDRRTDLTEVDRDGSG